MPESDTETPRNRFSKPSVSQVVMAILLGGLAFAITLQIKQRRRPTTPVSAATSSSSC